MPEEKKTLEDYREELRELEAHPLFEGDGVHTCSDGTEVNFRTTPKNIRIRMIGLEPEEVDEVLTINQEYRILLSRRLVLRRRVNGEPLFKTNAHWQKALERSEELLSLFGKMYSGQEVHKIVTTEWKLPSVKYELVLKFQRDNADTIAKLRDEYQKDVTSIRLVHKRSRLDELTELYSSRKMRYEDTETRSDYELMLKTLEQIRKEVEGQRLTINGQIQVEHEMAVQDHVNSEILKYLNINDIIIGRLCARLKVNPKYILYRLHTSYYSKFTGFLPSQMNEENEVMYPSQIVYDFNRIAELNKSLDIEDVEYKEEKDVKDEKKVNNLKELLQAKLKAKKDNLAEQRVNINNIDGK